MGAKGRERGEGVLEQVAAVAGVSAGAKAPVGTAVGGRASLAEAKWQAR